MLTPNKTIHHSSLSSSSLIHSSLFFAMEVKDLLTSSHFPPGFRFHPTDEELISCYLSKKVTSSLPQGWDIVADIDIYKFNPWDLPGKACFGDGEWFFFSPRERKYPNGFRPNRSAGCGYWKATGTDKPILGAGGTQCIGVKKALVFYEGRPPKGVKTDWVMHEYRILDSSSSTIAGLPSLKQKGSMRLDDSVLCRVRKKGNLSSASNDVADTCSPAESATVSAPSEENFAGNCFTPWDDDSQLLRYLFDSHDEILNLNPVGENYLELPSEVGSLKRKPSFGMLDEFMQMQPVKRLHDYSVPNGLFSQSDSPNSVNQDFPDYFI